ncbi:uncharacterized protein LJ206_008952 [Theristicus caerulescens]
MATKSRTVATDPHHFSRGISTDSVLSTFVGSNVLVCLHTDTPVTQGAEVQILKFEWPAEESLHRELEGAGQSRPCGVCFQMLPFKEASVSSCDESVMQPSRSQCQVFFLDGFYFFYCLPTPVAGITRERSVPYAGLSMVHISKTYFVREEYDSRSNAPRQERSE